MRRSGPASAGTSMGPILLAAAFALGAWLPAAGQAERPAGEGGNAPLLSAIAKLRAGGCARDPGTTARLRPLARLDQVARRIAQGTPGDQAAKAAGYRATQMLTISMRGYGSTAAVARELAKTYCKQILDPQLTEVGVHGQGGSWWIVFAAPFTPPPESATAVVAAEVLALVNGVRSQSRLCGRQRFDAAGPLRPHSLLDHAAAAHAHDMARHGYLEHRGRDGSQPRRPGCPGRLPLAQRGREHRVGPDHRRRGGAPMDPQRRALRQPHERRLVDMGIAFAVERDSPQGIYWVQALGRQR